MFFTCNKSLHLDLCASLVEIGQRFKETDIPLEDPGE